MKNALLFYSYDIESEMNIIINMTGSKFLYNTCYLCLEKYKSYHTYVVGTTSVIRSNIRLQLIGPTEFHDNKFDVMIMVSDIILYNYIDFSQNEAHYMMFASHILLTQPVMLNISKNNIPLLFYKTQVICKKTFSVIFCYAIFSSLRTQ